MRGHVDIDAVRTDAFGLVEDYRAFSTPVHRHGKHQILFAASGTMRLVAGGRQWTLPPQRAAFLRAGTPHATSSTVGVALRTVYLAKRLVPAPPADVSVFAVTPLAREMLLHAMRWGPDTPATPTRDAFFRALGGLALEWLAAEKPYWLPEPKSPELARAAAWTGEHLVDATVEGAAKAAHVSVRTLSRRFDEELQLPFRRYLQIARIMRSLELLAKPRASITTTAFAVGFTSVAAFAAAFHERTGETPSEYRARAAT